MGEKDASHYASETKTTTFQGKPITVTHLTPILTPEQRAKRKSEIEIQLYEVFSQSKKNREKA